MSLRATAIVLASIVMLAACAPRRADSPATEVPAPRHVAADGGQCGGLAGMLCGEGSYCVIEAGQCVRIADVSGVCGKKPEVCTQEYDPVCGCDARTYPNACAAAAAGVSVGTPGECPAESK